MLFNLNSFSCRSSPLYAKAVLYYQQSLITCTGYSRLSGTSGLLAHVSAESPLAYGRKTITGLTCGCKVNCPNWEGNGNNSTTLSESCTMPTSQQ